MAGAGALLGGLAVRDAARPAAAGRRVWPTWTSGSATAWRDILQRLMRRYDGLFDQPMPFSMGWHQAPFDGRADRRTGRSTRTSCRRCWSATKRKFMVGYELLSEPQRDITAEDAAERLRSAGTEAARDGRRQRRSIGWCLSSAPHDAIGHRSQRAAVLARLADEHWDLVVIGGGIVGSGVLLDATSRGLRAALVEQDDLAVGTSSRSSRLIHGGLRYLEDLRLHLVREALAERSRLLRLAPHLVHLERFLFPVYGWPARPSRLLWAPA